MYVRYNAQKVGFLGRCRPLVGLDGCHLKGKFGGHILSATARDENDNIFPVALGVVEQENKDTWVWFLQTFANDIGRPDELTLVFISNRQKGLIPTMEMLFPTVEHRLCVKHIYNNFKLNFKGLELKVELWRCAATTTVREFEKRIQDMKILDKEAWEDKPIIAMLEWIRVRLMSRIYSKRTGIENFTSDICTNIVQKLEQLKVDSKSFSTVLSGCYIYEVDNEYERHMVNLTRKCCTCRVWDLTGIPCKHSVAAIYKNLERPEDYVHACYKKDTCVVAYKEMITPLPDQDEWVETNQLASVAPIVYKPPGKPPMKRKKDADEPNNPYKVSRSYRPIKYGFCHKEGYNSWRCKAGITSETPWQRRQSLERQKKIVSKARMCLL
ncbi:uncharacterized protein LOC142644096 [Castanea sativa]|uniref:uncharacterized protein LOC142644096 n=1 Tax=Castanea sativa TaxID=21020 RepID=UPI003F64E4FD